MRSVIFVVVLALGLICGIAAGDRAPDRHRLEAARQALEAGDPARAEALYRQSIAEAPQSVAAYQGLAAALAARGAVAEALEVLTETGRGLARARRWGEAVAPLEAAVDLAPERADLWRLLGRSLAEVNRFEDALEALERARERGDRSVDTLLFMAGAHWEMRRWDAAESLYHAALEVDDTARVRFQLGQLLLFQGRAAEAAGELERAADRAGENTEILFHLARARAEAGRLAAAVDTYERLLELDPGHEKARYLLDLLRREAMARGASPLAATAAPRRAVLEVATREMGLDFRHDPGATAARHLPETMGAGLAWIDIDGDGWRDLFLVQSRGASRLYRNLSGSLFEDVTERSGAGDPAYGQGALAGDLDGDGDLDLYLANVGRDTVLENRGDGTFVDAGERFGLAVEGWSSSAALADADLDGDLDLYVVRYVRYDPAEALACGEPGHREYCNVLLFPGLADRLFRRENDGFADATAAAGLDLAASRGLGVVWVDLDGDGRADLYVANDLDANRLLRGRGDGTFEDVSLVSGTALNGAGQGEAGMGVAAGDLDGDGWPELLVTNFDVETNTLYRNLGELLFTDISAASGFGLPSTNLLGFGIELADWNGDGALDAWVANGHVFLEPKRDGMGRAQRDLLLLGDGRGGFQEQELSGWPVRVGRGAAAADLDNDGDLDLALQANGGPAEILRNATGIPSWLGVELVGRGFNSEAIGARVTLRTRRHDGTSRHQVRWVMAGRSYQSSSDRRLVFTWPAGETASEIEVLWPLGRVTRIASPPAGRYLRWSEP